MVTASKCHRPRHLCREGQKTRHSPNGSQSQKQTILNNAPAPPGDRPAAHVVFELWLSVEFPIARRAPFWM